MRHIFLFIGKATATIALRRFNNMARFCERRGPEMRTFFNRECTHDVEGLLAELRLMLNDDGIDQPTAAIKHTIQELLTVLEGARGTVRFVVSTSATQRRLPSRKRQRRQSKNVHAGRRTGGGG
jgi:hypothetical protein